MSGESFLDGRVVLHAGNCLEVMTSFESNSVDAVVTDPPYGLEFMGRDWDGADGFRRSLNAADAGRESVFGRTSRKSPEYKTGPIFQQFMHAMAREALRVLKPGGHLVAFAGTRTYHRLACAVEDAGFEIRDQIAWCYGSGFPKSRDVSKAIDDEAGASRKVVSTGGAPVKRMIPGADQHKEGWEKNNGREFVPTVTEAATEAAREWQGWGTALKPAWEPIVLARKPFDATVASNVLKHGVGAINIDGCRVATDEATVERQGEPSQDQRYTTDGSTNFAAKPGARRSTIRHNNAGTGDPEQWRSGNGSAFTSGSDKGRWPANIIHDGSNEVIAAFPQTSSGEFLPHHRAKGTSQIGTFDIRDRSGEVHPTYGDEGSAARFFYTAKADSDDRLGSKHPTVKPVDLMQWLCRLVTPKGGTVLDPFAGTGTTGEAAFREGFRAVLIEKESESQTDIRRRMGLCLAGPGERRRESAKAKQRGAPIDEGPLFSI